MSDIFNSEGEPLITASALRFEAYLDSEPDIDRYYDRYDNEGELLNPHECRHANVDYSGFTAECQDCESLGLVLVHVAPWNQPGTQDGDFEFDFIAWQIA